jgi:hypothetical protein
MIRNSENRTTANGFSPLSVSSQQSAKPRPIKNTVTKVPGNETSDAIQGNIEDHEASASQPWESSNRFGRRRKRTFPFCPGRAQSRGNETRLPQARPGWESPTLTLRSRSRAGTSQQELGFAASFAMQKHDAMNCKGFICLLLSEDSQMPESR